jgi:hypothetical protein
MFSQKTPFFYIIHHRSYQCHIKSGLLPQSRRFKMIYEQVMRVDYTLNRSVKLPSCHTYWYAIFCQSNVDLNK